MRSAEGRSPFAGSLRVSLRYRCLPPSWQEGGKGDGRSDESGFSTLLGQRRNPKLAYSTTLSLFASFQVPVLR